MGRIITLIHAVDHGELSAATRRHMLVVASSVMAGAGVVAAACPFVESMEPSARTRALGAPVDFDLSGLAPGQLKTVAWRGKPVWVMRRTKEMVRALERADPNLADAGSTRSQQPAACKNATRSLRPDIFVCVGICTHLGCTPILHLDDAALNAELHAPGGFICPCHGSRFDLAGRVVRNVPAPINLTVPDYRFTAPATVRIG